MTTLDVWMVWVQGDGEYVWLEAAWDDDTTAENHAGWLEEVGRVKKLCFDNGYEMRIQKVSVPGVFEAFRIPEVSASIGGIEG